MTAPPPVPLGLDHRPDRRSVANTLATGWMVGSLVVVVAPLILVLGSLVVRGMPVMFREFPAFFTSEIPIRARAVGPGMGPAILGTLSITVCATVMAVPLGILGAVYLHEYGGQHPIARGLRFVASVTTSVPSIVMGLFVYLGWTLVFGLSGFGGSLALACLMLPIVLRSTEEMLRLVPDSLREAAFALGATRSRTIVTVVLPAALPGIVSGCLLAVARAAGETAPLVFTIGAATAFVPDPFHGANTALSAQIFTNATSPFVGAQERAWGAALTLVSLSFGLTWLSRAIAARFALVRRGSP